MECLYIDIKSSLIHLKEVVKSSIKAFKAFSYLLVVLELF